MLWKFVDQSVLKKFEKRKDIQTRSAKVANTEDIIKAFMDMDKASYEEAVFVAADIKRVPTQHPEQLHELSIVRRIEALENNFKLVESGSSNNQIQISDLSTVVETLRGSIESNTKLINNIAEQVASIPSHPEKVPEEGSDEKEPERESNKEVDIVNKVRSWSHPMLNNSDFKTNSNLAIEKVKESEKRSTEENKPVQRRKQSYRRPYTFSREFTQEKRHFNVKSRSHDSVSGYSIQNRNRGIEQVGTRPLGLRKDISSQQDGYRKSNPGGKAPDDVFFPDRSKMNRKHCSGFSFTREHFKKVQNKLRKNDSQLIRLFIYNVPKKFSVDEVYDHLANQEINIIDLWQSSHVNARRKSFVVKVPRNVADMVMQDRILEELDIGVREYTDRSEN